MRQLHGDHRRFLRHHRRIRLHEGKSAYVLVLRRRFRLASVVMLMKQDVVRIGDGGN